MPPHRSNSCPQHRCQCKTYSDLKMMQRRNHRARAGWRQRLQRGQASGPKLADKITSGLLPELPQRLRRAAAATSSSSWLDSSFRISTRTCTNPC